MSSVTTTGCPTALVFSIASTLDAGSALSAEVVLDSAVEAGRFGGTTVMANGDGGKDQGEILCTQLSTVQLADTHTISRIR